MAHPHWDNPGSATKNICFKVSRNQWSRFRPHTEIYRNSFTLRLSLRNGGSIISQRAPTPGGASTYYYRPETRFAKVMFSQVSVCPQRGCLPLVLGVCGRHPPGQTPGQTPPRANIPRADTPWADTSLHSACWDMVDKCAVCIPPECILVPHNFPPKLPAKIYRSHPFTVKSH